MVEVMAEICQRQALDLQALPSAEMIAEGVRSLS